jgi:hypothetical protein
VWLGILLALGAGGLMLGQEEMAFLVVASGIFVAAQAADVDARWEWLYRAVLAVVVVFTALAFVALAVLVRQLDLAAGLRGLLVATAAASAAVTLLTLHVPVADRLVRLLFRVPHGSHTLRLAARLTLFGLLFALPGWFAFRDVVDQLIEDPGRLIEDLALGGSLVGYVTLALASIGFLVRRDLAASLERLGVGCPTLRAALVVLAGAAALFVLNGAGEVVQRTYLPALWEQDRRMTEAIVGGLSAGGAVVLGLSAGVGEEITLRGALQPRLGVLLTSLLFAALHVQYSWFGMLMIFVFGCVLGLIRARTNTTVAMGVHTVYDIGALLVS